jgi:hypothetical protein
MAEARNEDSLVPPALHGFRREGGGSVPERLVVHPRTSAARLLAALAAALAEPYLAIYVLLESGTFRPEGRWQTSQPLSRDALATLLDRFAPFLDRDGRHGLWIISGGEPAGVALDRRGVVSVHGSGVERALPVLSANGLSEGELVLPEPRSRLAELDADEARLLASHDWTWFPLEPGDDALD